MAARKKPAKKEFDLLIKNVRVVRPNAAMVDDADIGIKNGKFAKIAPGIAGQPRRSRPSMARTAWPFPAWSTRTCTPASTRRWMKMR